MPLKFNKILINWLSFCVLLFGAANAQQAPLIGKGSVQAKNYYLLTLMEKDKAVRHLLERDTLLTGMTARRTGRFNQAVQGSDCRRVTGALKFTEPQYETIRYRLGALYDRSPILQKLVKEQLIPSGCYALYGNLSSKEQLLKAWELDAEGIDRAIAIYGEGQKPNYPDIDSISFRVNSPAYADTVKRIVRQALSHTGHSKLFFALPLHAALAFLNANDRNDAGNYEPMEKTVNKAAIRRAKKLNWNNYKYTVLLVPGEGPEQYGVAIDPIGKQRCRLVAKAYNQKLAPFIMVSGGKVHPYKTHFCEAEEMKSYLIDSLKISENAIIMEPHARHTTTNLRNGVRLILKYRLPTDKPGLIVSNKADNDYIIQMDRRYLNELGYVPYTLGKRISDTGLEFYPKKEALTINATEPLDP